MPQGRLLYYEGTVEDITQRRQAEENLRNSEALYHSLVETLPQNIFRKDLQGRFTFANQQFCKILGRTLEDIVGKTDFDFFPRELAEKYQRDDRRVMETGKTYETVEEHQPPGRRKIYVQVVKTPLYGADGAIIGLQGIFWDITQQRLAEEKIRRANALLAQSRKELRAKNAQMEDDLKMAREIQLTMLPQQYPAFPRSAPPSESAFQFTHRYLPAGTVGGDFFTVSALSEDEAGVFICDVAGHGVRSALVTAMIRALVEELKPVATNPGQFLSKLNSDLHAILKHTGTPHADHRVLPGGRLENGHDALRQRRPSQTAAYPPQRRPGRTAGQCLGQEPARARAVRGRDLPNLRGEALASETWSCCSPTAFTRSRTATTSFTPRRCSWPAFKRRAQLPAPQLFDELLAEIGRHFSGTTVSRTTSAWWAWNTAARRMAGATSLARRNVRKKDFTATQYCA